MGDKLTDYYDVHNVLYVLFLLRCYGTLVDTGVDERTTIKKKIVHLGTTYIKWAELQMTDAYQYYWTLHALFFFYIRVP